MVEYLKSYELLQESLAFEVRKKLYFLVLNNFK